MRIFDNVRNILKMDLSITNVSKLVKSHAVFWMSLFVMINMALARNKKGSQEYCQTEAFEAACPHADEIIYIEQALYGRMKLGKCVQTNYGHVGCQSDVLRHTDRRCSGKRICRITIPDAVFDLTEPCPLEFKTYLQVSYRCQKITVPEQPSSCVPDEFLKVKAPSGYLASITTEERGYGSVACPWKIVLPRGQRINITLIDFTTSLYDRRTPERPRGSRRREYDVFGNGGGRPCRKQYAIITEKGSASGRSEQVCGGPEREKHVILSDTNVVEIRVISSNGAQFGDENFFLLKYEAVGCPNPEQPLYGWVNRDEDIARMGCNFTSHTWQLHCEANSWVGPHHNCSADPPSRYGENEQSKGFVSDYGPDGQSPWDSSNAASIHGIQSSLLALAGILLGSLAMTWH